MSVSACTSAKGLQLGESTLLVDGFHTEPACPGNREVIDPFTIEQNLPGGGLMVSGDDLDQRGLAGPVIAQQTHNLIPTQLKIDVLKCLHLSKRFGHVSKFQAIIHRVVSVPAFYEVNPARQAYAMRMDNLIYIFWLHKG